jgi:hypothetical protein
MYPKPRKLVKRQSKVPNTCLEERLCETQSKYYFAISSLPGWSHP